MQMTIGAKRNELCRRATGQIIAMFDDDDYYAPHYLKQMVSLLEHDGADLAKLYGFFQYDIRNKKLGYWDRSGNNSEGKYSSLLNTDLLGFGFSYVFKRKVWEAVPFPNMDFGEDHTFMGEAIKKFELTGVQDRNRRSCLKIVHAVNSSTSHFREVVPSDWLPFLFPHFSGDGS